MKSGEESSGQNQMPLFRELLSGMRSSFNLLFPNRCLFCHNLLDTRWCVCSNCLAEIPILVEDVCSRCGAPLNYCEASERTAISDYQDRCYHCRELDFDFQKNESLGVFDGMMRELIHQFKFGGRRSLFRVFSELLLVHKASYIREHDAIIPVPLSQARFRERGFNQSYMIGKTIAVSTNIPFLGNILLRRGRSKPQSSIKSLRERRENLTDRFFLRKKGKEMVRGKSILLIDDVLTTGATASACARVLYLGGAVRVNLLSMARALREP